MIFVESPEHLQDFLNPDRDRERGFASPIWSVAFWQPWEAPCAEHDLWLDSALPSSPDAGIPMAVRVGPGRRVRRASPRMLAFFAAMFRAVAGLTLADRGRGAWTARAVTSRGEVEVSLRLLGSIV